MEHPSRENPEMTNRSKDYEKGGLCINISYKCSLKETNLRK